MNLIKIDNREPLKISKAIAREHPVIPIEIEQLPAGDIWILGSETWVIIERKTMSDLLASIADGRLENQIYDALQLTPHVALFIEGLLQANNDGYIIYYDDDPLLNMPKHSREWTLYSVWGKLTKIQIMGAILRVYQKDLGKEVISVYNLFSKTMAIRPRKPEITTQPLEVSFLASLPGVGPTRAAAIWQATGSLYAALWFLTDTNDETWPDIPGIGPKTKENVRKFIGSTIIPHSLIADDEEE